MANPVDTACGAQEGSFLKNLFSGPVFILIIFAILMIVMNYFKDKKEKKSFENMKNSLAEGKTVRLRDDTVGVVVSINQEKGTIIINSAGTQLEKNIDAVLTVFNEEKA